MIDIDKEVEESEEVKDQSLLPPDIQEPLKQVVRDWRVARYGVILYHAESYISAWEWLREKNLVAPHEDATTTTLVKYGLEIYTVSTI